MRRTVVVIMTAAVLVAAAPNALAARAHAPLRGTNWVLTNRVSVGTPLGDVAVNAVFDKKRVSGTSGTPT